MPATLALDPVRDITLAPAEIAFYQEQGYLPLPGFLKPDAVSAIRDEVMTIMQDCLGLSASDLSHASEAADKLRQCSQYLAGSQLDSMINGEKTLAIASQLIGGPAVRYLPFTAVKAGGGGGTFHFHQDNNYTNHDPALGSINIWVALVDMAPENGCLQVIPKTHEGIVESHSSDDGDAHQQIDVDPEVCLPVRMRAGDAVAFTRWTVHGSGPNHTDSPRAAYALQYHRDDVKFLDKEANEWKLLTAEPRFATPARESLTRQG